jgi:hypothetical protein
MDFQFINNNGAISHSSRKMIRSHAMKGMNLGKSIPARGHKHAQPINNQGRQTKKKTEKENTVDHIEKALSPLVEFSMEGLMTEMSTICISRNLLAGSEYDYFEFPIRFTPSMRFLVHECMGNGSCQNSMI